MKGGPLTKEESEKVIGAYEKESGTKPTTSKGGYGGGTNKRTTIQYNDLIRGRTIRDLVVVVYIVANGK